MSSHALILQNIDKHISLTAEEQEHFRQLLDSKKVKKRQFILRENEICKHSYFVNSGCLRSYSIDKNGFEHVLSFAPQSWWIADMYSYFSQQPGQLNIDALEDTEVLMLSKENQDQLYVDIPKFERFFRILIEKSLVAHQKRLMNNLSLPASERFQIFCEKFPQLIQRIPQKQIASFIGVTPEFLSKLKAEYLRNT